MNWAMTMAARPIHRLGSGVEAPTDLVTTVEPCDATISLLPERFSFDIGFIL